MDEMKGLDSRVKRLVVVVVIYREDSRLYRQLGWG